MFSRAIRIILSFKQFLSYSKNSLLFLRPKEQPKTLSSLLKDSNLTKSCGICDCGSDPTGRLKRSRARLGVLVKLGKMQLSCLCRPCKNY